ncbi:MAG: hypothetical protein J6O51_06110 [Bacteroidales bacterium]|nr:hypothetical protein [Bacteroidales bacterium]
MSEQSKTVVRGVYDSPEEEYARTNGLTFIHDRILVARAHFENPGGYENRFYYLCFKDSGQPYIRKEIYTPGISAGSCMGGEFDKDLPMDFLVDCDLEKFSDEFPMHCYEQILQNSDLAEFIRKWNLRHGEGA